MKKLKIQLCTPKKGISIYVYLLEINKIIDTSDTIGSSISTDDHVEDILNGCLKTMLIFVTFFLSWIDPYIVTEIEALLF